MRHAPGTGIRPRSSAVRLLLLGSTLALSLATLASPADAARSPQKARETHAAAAVQKTPIQHAGLRMVSLRTTADSPAAHLRHAVFVKRFATNILVVRPGSGSKLTKNAKARVFATRYTDTDSGALQCVPFARAASGIELKGNAVNWWDAAAGVYERGNRPEPGAVLNFRANGNMRLGHVAVVRQIVNRREIEIDHANWAWSDKGNVSRGVAVIDVSERNDWTAVRVALGHGEDFGSIYSTYGFIYDRPDNGSMVASSRSALNAPPRDVRAYDEIAEAPGHANPADDAPARSVR